MNKIDSVVSALKKDFTREEIAKMDKKEIKKFAKTKGFAIGTILLAIALIAAIGAAIAVASKAGSSDTSSQTSKLGAANIVNMGSSIKTTFDKFRINGADVMAGGVVFNPNANGTVESSAAPGVFPQGIFNPSNGVNYTNLPANGAALYTEPTTCNATNAVGLGVSGDGVCTNGGTAAGDGYAGWYLTKNFTSDAGTNAADFALMRKGITADACLEVNKQVNGNTKMTTATIPSSALAAAGIVANATITVTTGGAQDTAASTVIGGNEIVSKWTEGCFKTTDATPTYLYFNIVKVN